MNGRRLQFGIGVIDGLLYVVGGRDGLKTLNTVECFDPQKKQWKMMNAMATHRHGLGQPSSSLQQHFFLTLSSHSENKLAYRQFELVPVTQPVPLIHCSPMNMCILVTSLSQKSLIFFYHQYSFACGHL